ncbi:E3 ubiquitin-protein ligase TRAIP [Nilaparvata lugens]|uniref:E3 ubiquitin-protein ligase TRAIP n=1 Tax=Nilaparvata lugens TaxID=108931 RepID=UPI000B986CA9|nr:E3 ubiquitin-protein ligase TRAIP [Nilaparvata lugens]XP_022197246.1 E3 ubiquitin-protein ligase TRAIP [Nilaparvata lugens]
MHITCVICGDLFTGTNIAESVYSTPCGHLFHHHCLMEWLGRSPSCPQCRQKTSDKKITRIFFNLSSTSENDASALAFQVDSLQYKLDESGREIKLLKAERDKYSLQAKGLRQEVIQVSNKEKKLEQCVHALRSEVTLLKKSCKAYGLLLCENEELKRENASLKKIKDIIHGSDAEVDEALEDADAYPNLRQCITFFKKRIKTLLNEHKNVQAELNIQKRKRLDLELKLSSLYEERRVMNLENKGLKTIASIYTGNRNPAKKMSIDKVDTHNDEEEQLFEISDDERREQKEETEVSYNKPVFAHTSRSSALQPNHKIQHSFRGALKQSFPASSASGSDNFHPRKYSAAAPSKVGKKLKKKLCPSAVSAIRDVQKASTATSEIAAMFFDSVKMTAEGSRRRASSPSTSRFESLMDSIDLDTPPSERRANHTFSDIDEILDTVQLLSPSSQSSRQASKQSNSIDLT